MSLTENNASAKNKHDWTSRQLLDFVVDHTIARAALNVLLATIDADVRMLLVHETLTLDVSARDDDVARVLLDHSGGFDLALRDACTSNNALRQKLATALQLPAQVSDAASIVDELWLRGTQSVLLSLQVGPLRELALAFRISTEGTRAELAKRVLMYVAVLAPAPKRRKRSAAATDDSGAPKRVYLSSRSIDNIKPGVSADELAKFWTGDVLRDFARANAIPAQGTKATLCERIIAFLDSKSKSKSKRSIKKSQ
jgi:hypothetical protein